MPCKPQRLLSPEESRRLSTTVEHAVGSAHRKLCTRELTLENIPQFVLKPWEPSPCWTDFALPSNVRVALHVDPGVCISVEREVLSVGDTALRFIACP